jgi:RHS repeat-associated protein
LTGSRQLLNNSLTQVLADGANRYLYGMGRIAQQAPGGLQYFLPDALGSARQLTDVAEALALVQSFDPYGGLLASQGSAATPYGYAGEWEDGGLIYLRARYYLPQAGIFTARDPFPGVTTLPVTLQPYLYAAGNPLRYTDPSGRFIDTVIDIAFIGYDAYSLVKHINSGCGVSKEDLLALGLDVVGALLPFATGLGMVARIGNKTDDAIRLAAKMEEVREAGRSGELLAGILKNTKHIDSLTGTAKYRIPDQLLERRRIITEVKNVSELSLTKQLRDFIAYARENEYTFELVVREGANLSVSLQEIINRGEIILRRILP